MLGPREGCLTKNVAIALLVVGMTLVLLYIARERATSTHVPPPSRRR